MVANFEKNVYNPDTTLTSRIIQEELPAFIYKCLTYYKQLLEKSGNCDIWHICPEYFRDQQQDMKTDSNPLYKFLSENTRYKKDNVVLMEDVRKAFNDWSGKHVKKLDNGTFGQVNQEYIIDIIKICKHCKNEAKSGCCDQYSNRDRTRKTVLKHLEMINEIYLEL
jgi:hypothetical protein